MNLPAPKTMEQFIGEEVFILAEHVLEQAKFTGVASQYVSLMMPDGRRFELSVAAKSDRQTIDEPVRP